MESNGVPRDRMFAINFTNPLARGDDKVPQDNRSSTEDQRRELGEAIARLKQRTGNARLALVGNSRGGNSIRSYIKNGGGADVSHVVLCGVLMACLPGMMVSATSSTAAAHSCAA